MKAAIVRGPSLNAWEMQTYEPLASEVELTAVGAYLGHHDTSDISFPVKKLICPGSLLAYVPGGILWLYRTLGDPQFLIDFDRFIEDFDIVHAAELGSFFSLQAVQAKERGLVRAVTLTIYENISNHMDDSQARKIVKRRVVQGADHFMVASGGAKEALIAEGADAEKISVVPQGIDTRRFKPRESQTSNVNRQSSRKRYGLSEEDLVVLSVGRLVKEKGFSDLIQGADTIANGKLKIEGGRKLILLLVGEGPEKRSLESLVREMGVYETVVFAGGISYSEMPEIYRSADVFVLASRPTQVWKEQFGYVLLEAMASGLPIVATETGAIPEVVGSEAGILVPADDPGALAQAISKLAGNEKLRESLGERARERVLDKYDSRVVSGKILEIWKRLLEDER